jgi:hypothetical protein
MADVNETHIKRFPAFSAHNSRRGVFTGTEFRALWLQCLVKCPKSEGLSLSIRKLVRNIKKPKTATSRKRVLQETESTIQGRIDKIVSQHLKNFRWGALLRPVVEDGKITLVNISLKRIMFHLTTRVLQVGHWLLL